MYEYSPPPVISVAVFWSADDDLVTGRMWSTVTVVTTTTGHFCLTAAVCPGGNANETSVCRATVSNVVEINFVGTLADDG